MRTVRVYGTEKKEFGRQFYYYFPVTHLSFYRCCSNKHKEL